MKTIISSAISSLAGACVNERRRTAEIRGTAGCLAGQRSGDSRKRGGGNERGSPRDRTDTDAQLSTCRSGARRWSMTSAVLPSPHDAVQVLVMNNPAARNAITAELYASLPAALAEAEADPQIGAIVLT